MMHGQKNIKVYFHYLTFAVGPKFHIQQCHRLRFACLLIAIDICVILRDGCGHGNSQLYVGFTLSQATKARRESRGIALFYFRPRH